MSIVDTIIAIVVISFCASILTGLVVYYILNKKHEEDIDWLFNSICATPTELQGYIDSMAIYQEHIANQHKCFERYPEEF